MKHAHPGMTLLETLAVVVILAAATAVMLGVSGTMSAGHERLAAIAAVRDAIDRTRLLAESSPYGDGSELIFGESLVGRIADDTYSGDALSDGTGPRVVRVDLPAHWSAALLDDDEPAEKQRLRFGPDGSSGDAMVRVEGPVGAFAELELLGVSGQINDVTNQRGVR